jgi:hypothetical protein
MDYTGYTITTGSLAGNLFAESSDEGGTYDVNASAKRYAEMCQEALEKEFPGAEIEIEYQLDASGATPIPLQTCITAPGGPVSTQYGEGKEIADQVYETKEQVWQSWEWVVYAE